MLGLETARCLDAIMKQWKTAKGPFCILDFPFRGYQRREVLRRQEPRAMGRKQHRSPMGLSSALVRGGPMACGFSVGPCAATRGFPTLARAIAPSPREPRLSRSRDLGRSRHPLKPGLHAFPGRSEDTWNGGPGVLHRQTLAGPQSFERCSWRGQGTDRRLQSTYYAPAPARALAGSLVLAAPREVSAHHVPPRMGLAHSCLSQQG